MMIKKVVMLGNAQSPHLRQWLEHCDDVTVLSLPPLDGQMPVYSDGKVVFFKFPFLRSLPVIFQYFLLGIYARLRFSGSTFHAHNASGYGFSALVSANEYVLTTYGSEIYSAPKRGRIYQWMIRLILKRASIITATSPQMLEALSQYGVAYKTRVFSLGVSDEFLSPLKNKNNNFPVWFANRRVAPLYNTKVVIEAFSGFIESGGEGELWLLEGDSDARYLEEVREMIFDFPKIKLIDGFIERKDIAELLDKSDYVISVPDSDQLSSSILEGMARGCIPILSPLASYSELKSISVTVSLERGLLNGLEEVFRKTSADRVSGSFGSSGCRNFILENYSSDIVKFNLKKLYEELM